MHRYVMNHKEMSVQVTEWGSANTPVIFCLHGLGSTGLSFIEVAEELKDKYRLISIDAPGHGNTPPFNSSVSYELPRMAVWLDELFDLLQIEDFYFLSHSWGSFAALYYLVHSPNRVKGSLLIDGGYQTKHRMTKTLEEEIAHYEQDFNEYVFADWQQFLVAEHAVYTRWSPLLENAVADLGREKNGKIIWHASGETAKHIIQAMHKHETEDIYSLLPNNILLLTPENEESYYQETRQRFVEQTGAEMRTVPYTTHLLHWDKPALVAETVTELWPVIL